MDLETLRSVQTPIKEKYRLDPESAKVELHARGIVDVSQQRCDVDVFGRTVQAGLHPAAGGIPSDACSAEMLLQSLVACAGVTLGAVATNMSIQIRSAQIIAKGLMDFRGTLGVDRSAPVGLTSIELEFQIDSDASSDSIEKLISLAERYCVIYQTLKQGVPVMQTRFIQG